MPASSRWRLRQAAAAGRSRPRPAGGRRGGSWRTTGRWWARASSPPTALDTALANEATPRRPTCGCGAGRGGPGPARPCGDTTLVAPISRPGGAAPGPAGRTRGGGCPHRRDRRPEPAGDRGGAARQRGRGAEGGCHGPPGGGRSIRGAAGPGGPHQPQRPGRHPRSAGLPVPARRAGPAQRPVCAWRDGAGRTPCAGSAAVGGAHGCRATLCAGVRGQPAAAAPGWSWD
jgi:hypothetical protein